MLTVKRKVIEEFINTPIRENNVFKIKRKVHCNN